MKNKVRPTKFQKSTIEVLAENPKIPIGKAMIAGGYSAVSALNPKANFIDRAGTAIAIEQWRKLLRGTGITEERIAKKINEMLDAKMIKTSLTEPDKQVPDYKTQIEAVKMVREDLGIKQPSDLPENLKRRVIAEEFFGKEE